MTSLQCPGCIDSRDFTSLVALRGGREIRRCERCQLVFTHPMPTGEEIANFYQGFTFGKPKSADVAAHQKIIDTNVARIVEDLRSAGCHFGSALDFGGGLGYYANAFADHFESVDMFDLDRVALDHARALFPDRFGLYTTETGAVPQFDRKYDLVFANQVIEHYTDLNLFFTTLCAAAHKNTIFVITTPNNRSPNLWVRPEILKHYSGIGARNLWGRLRNIVALARNSWACCDPPRHVFAFDQANLTLVVERFEMKALWVSSMYCTDDYYSPAKYQVVPIRSAKMLGRRVFNSAVRKAIRILRRFDPGAQRGDDLVLVAKFSRGAA